MCGSLNHGYQHITEHKHSRESQQYRESSSLRDLPAVAPTSLTSARNTEMTYSRSRPASYREVELAAQHCAGFRENADRTQSLVTHFSAAPRDSLPICDSWSSGRPLLSAQPLTAAGALRGPAAYSIGGSTATADFPPASELGVNVRRNSGNRAATGRQTRIPPRPLTGPRPPSGTAHDTRGGPVLTVSSGPDWRPGSRTFSRGRRPASQRRRRP